MFLCSHTIQTAGAATCCCDTRMLQVSTARRAGQDRVSPRTCPALTTRTYLRARRAYEWYCLLPLQVHFAAYAGPQGAAEAPPGISRRAAAADAAARAEGSGLQPAAAAGDAAV